MRRSRTWWTVLAVSSLALAQPSAALAQAAPQAAAAEAIKTEIDELKQEFNSRLSALEARLVALERSTPAGALPVAAAPAAPGSETPGAAPPNYNGGASASKVFNPDIAVIGNFLGASGKNVVAPQPALQMAESEVSLQAVVDPYAKADFFIAFGEEGVDLEEGDPTFTSIPGGLLTKVGKMRAAFGKVNTLHSHVLPWADRPLVIENLMGGEDGISDAGLSVARLLPNPWLFLEATGQVYRGDSDELFHSSRRSDLSYVGHLRGYHDITESTNLDLGASFSRGHNASGAVDGVDIGRFTTQLFGVDATLRWRPLQRAIYHSFIARSEAIWSRRDQPDGRQQASGFFVSGDYQLGRRWFTGLRLDRSDRADAADMHDSGASVTVTYMPSEFSQIRGQGRRTRYAEGVTANEFLFQFQFAIGAHGAHPF